eukprot:1936776-Rhodomonas_salina.1
MLLRCVASGSEVGCAAPMCGTEIGYLATRYRVNRLTMHRLVIQVPSPISLRPSYAMSVTDIAYVPMRLPRYVRY